MKLNSTLALISGLGLETSGLGLGPWSLGFWPWPWNSRPC